MFIHGENNSLNRNLKPMKTRYTENHLTNMLTLTGKLVQSYSEGL